MKNSENYYKTLQELKSKPYTWGKLVEIHEIGNYIIVEYKSHKFEGGSQVKPIEYEENSSFHPFVNGDDFNESFGSLDGALTGAICINNNENTKAAKYFMKMIK